MGTRGFTAFRIDNKVFANYQQYDSYVEGVGVDVLEWARQVEDWDEVKDLARRLQEVPASEEPTVEQRAHLIEFANFNVSTGSDWYSAIHETQGDPANILKAGFVTNDGQSVLSTEDAGYIEYSWVIDLDAMEYIGHDGTLGSRVISRWSLAALPTKEEFIEQANGVLAALYGTSA